MDLRRPFHNRRLRRRHILDVRLRTRGARQVRVRLAATALAVALGTLAGLWTIWRTGEWLLDRLVFANNAFAIRSIVVLNEGRIPRPDVVRWAGVRLGENLLALDHNRVKRDLELVPLIRAAVVERVPPNTLRIHVAERRPVARVLGPRFGPAPSDVALATYYLDADGYVIGWADMPRLSRHGLWTDLSLPWLRGFPGGDLCPGRPVRRPATRAVLQLLTAFEQSPMAGRVGLASIDLSAPGLLVVEAGGSCVTFGYDRADEQMRRWRQVHDYSLKQGRRIRTLDLSVTNNCPVTFLDAATTPEPPTRAGAASHAIPPHV